MKKLFTSTLFFSILFLTTACQRQDVPNTIPDDTDTVADLTHIYNVYLTSPAKALSMVDSAEQRKAIPAWKADSLRAKMCLENYYDLNKSLEYALRTLSYDAVVQNPRRHMHMLTMISQIEVSLGRYSECISFSDKGYALSQQLKDNYYASRLMVNAGYSMYFMKEKKKGIEYLLKAQQLLTQSNDQGSMKTLSYCYGQLMSCLWLDNTDEAIRFGKMRENLLEYMEKNISDIPNSYLDTQKGLTFSKMADFYAQKKEFGEARRYEQKFLQTNLSKTPRGNNLILDYYCTTGNFQRVQQTYQSSLPYWEHRDTFCTRYASVLGMLTKAYHQQGLLHDALNFRTRQVTIKDSLLVRENQNEAMRLSAIYQMHEKEINLEKKRADAVRYGILAGTALVLLLLACAFAIYFYRQQTKMYRKNRLLISQLDAISDYQDRTKTTITPELETKVETGTVEQYVAPTVGKKRDLMVQRFRQIIDEEKAYLQLDFSREKLQRMMGISKNSLTPVLHEVLGDVSNLSDYINSKRIAHACKLLREQPHSTIDNIALESGFTTTRNFRRCFKSQTGMTPAEYRESIDVDETE